MKAIVYGCLVSLALPACLLVQPLDDVKSGDESSAHAGAGQHAGGSGPGAGGAGNKAGSGPTSGGTGAVPAGGGSNGGAPSGVDFSLFTGTWIVTSGHTTVTCEGGTPQTTQATAGATDTFGLGTISDLILNPGSDCELLADVTYRVASLNPASQDCTSNDGTYDYDTFPETFEFTVSADGKTANATLSTTVFVTDASSNESSCTTESTFAYKR